MSKHWLGTMGALSLRAHTFNAGWWQSGAVLDLDFAVGRAYNSQDTTKTTPDSILTYTSPSPKLVTGDDGVLGYAPHNVLTYSEQFDNAAWVKAQATVTADAAVAPDGTTTADALLDTAANNIHYIAHSISGLSPAGRTFTVSAYLKKSTLDYATVGISDVSSGSLYAVAVFDLNTGVVTTSGAVGTGYSVVSSSITDEGGGWHRCVVTAVAGTSVSFLRAVVGTSSTGVITGSAGGFQSYLGNGSGIYVWGAQCAFGASALTYVPTTTAAVYSLPIDHNPTTFEPLGVLIEEQRTNLLTYSEQFDNAAWTPTSTTLTANAATAPNGTTTADRLIEDTFTASHVILPSSPPSVVSGTVYTGSVYLKKGIGVTSPDWVQLTFQAAGFGAAQYANFNLNTGAVGAVSGATSSIQSVGNGWYRCSITATASASTTAGLAIVFTNNADAARTPAYAGAVTSDLYIWGAQLEAGAFPTSYIPTVASQVTRAADQVSILTSAFAYNAAEGAVYQEIKCAVESAGPWGFNDYTNSSNYFGWQRSGSNGWLFRSGTGSGTLRSFDVNTGYVVGDFVEMAARYVDGLENVESVNGQTVTNNGPVDPDPVTPTSFKFGRAGALNSQHIKRVTYFPTRKSDAELQVLSA